MNNITKTIQESLAPFNEILPAGSVEKADVGEYLKSTKNKLYIDHAYPESMYELDIEKVKSHLLQSQIRLLEVEIEEMRQKMFSVPHKLPDFLAGYNKAIKDQISSLSQIIEELKNN